MGEACRSAIQSLLGICGFIVLFSVILQMLGLLGVLGTLAHCIKPLLQWLGWDPRWSGVLVVGTVDLTISMQLASHLKAATNQVFGITAAVIAWSGICIHAQVAAAIAHTDVRLSTYYGAKALQALLAGALIQWFGIQQATPLIPVWATRAFTGNNPGWTSLWQLVMIVLSLLLFLRPRESRIPPKVIQR